MIKCIDEKQHCDNQRDINLFIYDVKIFSKLNHL